MRSLVVATLALVMSVLSLPRSARAQSQAQSVRFAWVRAESARSCIDGVTLLRSIRERLRRDPFHPEATRSLEAWVERRDGEWRANLSLFDASGSLSARRTLSDRSSSCDPVTDALAVAIAIAIDPDAMLSNASASVATAPVRPDRRSLAPERKPTTVRTSARAVAVWGVLPSIAPAITLAIDGSIAERVRWMADAQFVREQRLPAPDAGFGFGLTSAALGLCAQPLASTRVTLTLCAALSVGAHHVVAFSVEPVQPGARPWVGAFARASIALRLAGPLFIEAGADGGASILRYQYTAQGRASAVFSQPPALASAFVGLGIEL